MKLWEIEKQLIRAMRNNENVFAYKIKNKIYFTNQIDRDEAEEVEKKISNMFDKSI